MKRRAVLLAVAIVASAARLAIGCAVDELDISSKDCPCVAGYVCDEAINKCVAGSELVRDSGPASDSSFTDAPLGSFTIASFGATYRASRSIRWDWEVLGDEAEFAEYQVITGASEDAVARRDSTTQLFDLRLNPELGLFGGRDPVAPGSPAKVWTVTDRLPMAKPAFARLIVRDKAGRENVSAIVSAETQPETHQLILFADAIPDGAAPTKQVERVTTDCYNDSAGCLQVGSVDCGDASTCTFDIGLQSLDNKTLTGMTAEQFPNAFVEVAVRGGSKASDAPHQDLVLTIGSNECRIDGNRCRFRFAEGWSFRPGAKDFRLVQVPLSLMLLDTPAGQGRALTYEDLAGNALAVTALTVSGEWAAGANIALDHGQVHW